MSRTSDSTIVCEVLHDLQEWAHDNAKKMRTGYATNDESLRYGKFIDVNDLDSYISKARMDICAKINEEYYDRANEENVAMLKKYTGKL